MFAIILIFVIGHFLLIPVDSKPMKDNSFTHKDSGLLEWKFFKNNNEIHDRYIAHFFAIKRHGCASVCITKCVRLRCYKFIRTY